MPSVTLSTNLWVFGIYLIINLGVVGFSTRRSIDRSVNSCQVRAKACVGLDLPPTLGGASISAYILRG